MRYVLDSSVAFKWFVPEIDSDKAIRILDDFTAQVHELLCPDVFPIELTHALTRAERQGRVTPDEGSQIFADLIHTLPDVWLSLPLLPRAYEISSQLRMGVYDCLYVALAERKQCELITADAKLAAHKSEFPFIVELSSMP